MNKIANNQDIKITDEIKDLSKQKTLQELVSYALENEIKLSNKYLDGKFKVIKRVLGATKTKKYLGIDHVSFNF